MKVYVLNRINGIENHIYGIFSSLEQADFAMTNLLNKFSETILDADYNTNDDTWLYFTDNSTYQIKVMFINSNAGM